VLVRARKPSARSILDAAIHACVDEIRHDWLLAHLPTARRMLQPWLQAGFLDTGQRFPTTAGTPEGGRLSPTLRPMTLDG
jgi:RNA-directed DNA polymerase